MQAQPVIGAFINGMVRQRQDVEDLVQIVAETCARKFSDFDADGDQRSFRSWALTIARFEVLRYYKRHQRDAIGFRPELLSSIASEFERRSESPDDRLAALRTCLERLTDRNRQLIEFRYYRGLNADQIADRLALSAGAVRSALCRSRRALADCIRSQIKILDHET